MRRYLTAGWLLRHAIVVVLVTAFLGLGWWQAQRAGAGNLSSYAYAVEWPVFAGFVIFMWIREMQLAARRSASNQSGDGDTVASVPASSPAPPEAANVPQRPVPQPATTGPDDEDDELAAYNRMLAWLNANPGRRFTDYPG